MAPGVAGWARQAGGRVGGHSVRAAAAAVEPAGPACRRTHNCSASSCTACNCGCSFASWSGVMLSAPPLRVASSIAGVVMVPWEVVRTPALAVPSLDEIENMSKVSSCRALNFERRVGGPNFPASEAASACLSSTSSRPRPVSVELTQGRAGHTFLPRCIKRKGLSGLLLLWLSGGCRLWPGTSCQMATLAVARVRRGSLRSPPRPCRSHCRSPRASLSSRAFSSVTTASCAPTFSSF